VEQVDVLLVAVLGYTVGDPLGIALGILAVAGAIVGGYVVSRLVPEAYYPRTFAVITANLVVAGLARLGVQAVAYGDFRLWFLMASILGVGAVYIANRG
jgi:hypothetical protein